MERITKTISVNDALNINKIFHLNNNMYKKLNLYSTLAGDSELEEIFEKARDMHLDNANRLIELLEGNDN